MIHPARGRRGFLRWLALAACVGTLLAPAAWGEENRGGEKKQEETEGPPEEEASRSSPEEQHASPPGGQEPLEGKGEARAIPLKVIGNFFFELPGLDLTTLTPRQRERFLQLVNREYCTCGACTKDTVANCYVNDPGCRSVREQARKILNEVKAGK